MEPSFVANPYVQASAPSSHKIREILDREEASYEAWRKTRKPVRLPYASLKLNSPLKPLVNSRHDLSRTKSTKAMQCTPKRSEACSKPSSEVDGHSRSHSQPKVMALNKFVKRKDALITGGVTRSAEVLPSLVGEQVARQKQVQFNQGADLPNKPSEGVITSSIAPRKATLTKFQHYLYDFHSRQVFSFSKNEADEFEDAMKSENAEKQLVCSDTVHVDGDLGGGMDNEGNSSARWNNPSENNSRQESHVRQSACLLSGLNFLCGADYDTIFNTDWKLSEAEKTVRDAVDRKRIHEILRRAYRMLLWFFRYYAGNAGNAAYAVASECRTGTSTVTALGEGLFEIPSRVRLLEDLNVQCVDGARFDVTDSPLKREGLITFLLNVARMMCAHSSNPNRLKMVINEGIEMSDAVKTLVRDHFGVFAQVQDVEHFRSLFLRKPEAFARMTKNFRVANGVGVPRRLRAIIETHKTVLTNFFDELVSTGAITRSGGGNDRTKGQQRQRGNGIECTQFLSTLRAINLITSRGSATGTANASAGDEAAAGGPSGVDEVRAVRIFLSCLPLTTVESTENEGVHAIATATVTSSTVSFEPRGLALSQFIEALLRVAFTWKELQICHGGFDVCPNQMTSDCCQCNLDSTHYAFDVFDDAAEEIFTRIHAYLLKRAQHRASMKMKSMEMKSHRSLHSLVAMTAAHRAPTRLLPVDEATSTYDAGT